MQVKLFADVLGTDFWVGAQQTEARGPYNWVNGKPFSADAWYGIEPNESNGASKACAYTYRAVDKLYDRPCGRSHGYACQRSKQFMLLIYFLVKHFTVSV